jgi:hypothetical protein
VFAWGFGLRRLKNQGVEGKDGSVGMLRLSLYNALGGMYFFRFRKGVYFVFVLAIVA